MSKNMDKIKITKNKRVNQNKMLLVANMTNQFTTGCKRERTKFTLKKHNRMNSFFCNNRSNEILLEMV